MYNFQIIPYRYEITGSTEEWNEALGKTKSLSNISISRFVIRMYFRFQVFCLQSSFYKNKEVNNSYIHSSYQQLGHSGKQGQVCGFSIIWVIFNPLTINVPHDIETSQLICIANQLIGSCMMGNLGRQWVNDSSLLF